MLLSPVMLIGTAIEQRRRGRRTRRRDAAAHRRSLDELDRGARRGASEERACAAVEQRLPGVGRRRGPRVADASARLWERRSHHHDAFVVSAGLGPVPWRPPVRGDRRTWSTEPSPTRSTGGPRPRRRAGRGRPRPGRRSSAWPATGRRRWRWPGRSSIQAGGAARARRPARRRGRSTDHAAADWDWTKWLPHTAATAAAVGPAVAVGRRRRRPARRPLWPSPRDGGGRRRPPADRTARGSGGGAAPVSWSIDDDLVAGADAPARPPAARRVRPPVAVIVVTDDADRLPVATSTVVPARRTPTAPAAVHRLDPAEVGRRRACRRRRRRRSPSGPPVRLAGLRPTPRRRPRRRPARRRSRCSRCSASTRRRPWLCGHGGPAAAPTPHPTPRSASPTTARSSLDLDSDGPHALIAGTTGSGKSELLRTLVASLAAGCAPDHLTFVLIDFKGGSAFAECARPAAHRRVRHRPRRAPGRPGAALPRGRAAPPRAGPRPTPGARTSTSTGAGRRCRRAAAPPRRRDRRVRHAGGRAARLRRRRWSASPSGAAASASTWCWPPNGRPGP